MQKRPDSLVYIIAIVSLIIVAIITTTIISSLKNNSGSATDIRARAGVINIVKLIGTVSDIDSVNGTLTVVGVQLAPESRSGPATNYGTWTVTPPRSFNLSSAAAGNTISFVVQSTSFDVASHKVVASQMTLGR